MRRVVSITSCAAVGIALCAAHAKAETIWALSTRNQLLTFDSATPGTINSSLFISGLVGSSEEVLGIDYRPSTGQLYALGSSNRVYTLNTTTAAATSVGTGFSPQLSGVEFGFDFNPVVDRIRVVSDLDQNLRLHPDTGAGVATDGALAYAATDPNAGANPNVVGAAYTNNFPGATATTLFDIDSVLDILVIQNPPNAGTLNTVGALGFNTSGLVGFDVAQSNGAAYASLTAPGGASSGFFVVNLTTGAAGLVGSIGDGTNPLLIRDIAALAVPEPGGLTLLGMGLAALIASRRRRRK